MDVTLCPGASGELSVPKALRERELRTAPPARLRKAPPVPSALIIFCIPRRENGNLIPRSGRGRGGCDRRGSPHPPIPKGATRTPRGRGQLRPCKHLPAHQRVPGGGAQPPRSRCDPYGLSIGRSREGRDLWGGARRRRGGAGRRGRHRVSGGNGPGAHLETAPRERR